MSFCASGVTRLGLRVSSESRKTGWCTGRESGRGGEAAPVSWDIAVEGSP